MIRSEVTEDQTDRAKKMNVSEVKAPAAKVHTHLSLSLSLFRFQTVQKGLRPSV